MRVRTAVAAAVLAAGGAVTVPAAGAADDLAVVKRAVARQQARGSVSVAGDERPARDEVRRGSDLKWLKVRVTEKGAKKARVTINLPIALVRALGDDYPLDFGRSRWRGEREKTVRLGEVLEALEAGSPLVEIDDEDALVKVWVE